MIRLAVRCRAELGERVLAELLELAPGGVEEEQGGGWVEYAIYGPPGELPELPELEAAAGEGLVEISSTEIPDDWADRWRDFHQPVSIANGRIVVRPSWAERATRATPAGADAGADEEGPSRRRGQGVRAGAEQPAVDVPAGAEQPAVDVRAGAEQPAVEVIIDPGQAFGTGAHTTTALCLELLVDLADAGEAEGELVDLGTGSGVLAIAAAKLGWGPVVACDSEPAALEAAERNATVNGVELELGRVNLRDAPAPVASTMVANLTAPLLVSVAERLADRPRALICAGLLATEVERVGLALVAAGLEPVERRARGDWGALLARRSDSGPQSG